MKKIVTFAIVLGALFTTQWTFAQTETSGREAVYRATHTKRTELKHTKLKVNFDINKEEMHGEEWLTASPYFYPSDSIVLNAKKMLIHEVALSSKGANQPLQYEYKDNLLKVNLGKTYVRGEEYTLYIKYTAQPNALNGKEAGLNSDKGLYFINPRGEVADKPTQIWTQGETESSSNWFPTIDKPNQKTTQEIYMTVPDKYVTLSNGVLKEQKKEGNGLRTDHWVMDKRHSPYLFMMAVGDFAIVKDHWRNIPVNYYIEKDYEPNAKGIYGHTPEMMEFFSKLLKYDYPWQKYDQIAVRDYVSGAMENTTATIHGEDAQQTAEQLADENSWETVIAHELFHHWFGDLVTTESWSNLTVNESFANYSEYLWLEHKYGKDFADYHLKNDSRAYHQTRDSFDKDLVRFNYTSKGDMFDNVTYNKGGAILHMLRNYLGDEAFFEGMHDYLVTNQFQTGEAHQLRLSFEKVSGKDLNWFFNQWYFGYGHPKLRAEYTFEPVKKQVRVTISQKQSPIFQFPLTLDIYQNGQPKREKVWVDAKENNTFTFSVDKNPELITLNPDGVLLAEIDDNKTAENYYVQFTKTKEFTGRANALAGVISLPKKNDSAIKTLVAALKDPFFRLRIQALNALDLNDAAQAKLALAQVEKLASSDEKTLVRAAAVMALSKTKNPKYKTLYTQGLEIKSNALKASSLVALSSVDKNLAVEYLKKMDLSKISDDLSEAIFPLIVENKIEKHMPIIAQTAALYPFIRFDNPTFGATAEKGYQWIMSSDNVKATDAVVNLYIAAKNQFVSNPMIKSLVAQILKDGLTRKMELLKANPNSASIKQQVSSLNKAVEAYQ